MASLRAIGCLETPLHAAAADSIIRGMADSDVAVERWRRYGKDRLYVSRGNEVKVGWWDLSTDLGHPATPEDAAVLSEAVSGWKADQAADGVSPVSAVAAPPVAVAPVDDAPTVRPWLDLSTNAPGAEAREQALSAREAAPVKSFLARALGVHTDERAWRIGADGEEKVAARLARLAKKDPRWRFIHAIPVGGRGSDIDHLAIGPGGLFTLNTKHHPGAKVWVGGDTTFLWSMATSSPTSATAAMRAERAAKTPDRRVRLPGPRRGRHRDRERRRHQREEATRRSARRTAHADRSLAGSSRRHPHGLNARVDP